MLSKFSGYQARNPHLGTTLVWDFGKLKEIEVVEKLLNEVEVAGRWLWVFVVGMAWLLGFLLLKLTNLWHGFLEGFWGRHFPASVANSCKPMILVQENYIK